MSSLEGSIFKFQFGIMFVFADELVCFLSLAEERLLKLGFPQVARSEIQPLIAALFLAYLG